MIISQQSKQQSLKFNKMAKVKLLKKVGDHEVGTELEILDDTVLAKWEELGVIESSKKEKVKKEDAK